MLAQRVSLTHFLPPPPPHTHKQSPAVQNEVLTKWKSLTSATLPLNVRRFQILVAARLHARVQKKSVILAMKNLRSYYSLEGVGAKAFDVETFASGRVTEEEVRKAK